MNISLRKTKSYDIKKSTNLQINVFINHCSFSHALAHSYCWHAVSVDSEFGTPVFFAMFYVGYI